MCFLRIPQKFTKSSPSISHLLHNVNSTVKISSIFVAFLENINFYNVHILRIWPYCLDLLRWDIDLFLDFFFETSWNYIVTVSFTNLLFTYLTLAGHLKVKSSFESSSFVVATSNHAFKVKNMSRCEKSCFTFVKVIYSEKATKFLEISTLLLTGTT